MSFLEDVVPLKVKSSKKLIGTDDKSNVCNYMYTNLVEICTLCKDDLLYLPKVVARHIGNISRLVLVKNITNVIHVIDPLTGQTGIIESDAYWRDPFRPVITAARTRLTRYVILGKDPVYLERNLSKKSVSKKQRSKLALITTAREADLGTNDSTLEERSHLGYLMKSGDVCLGYDLRDTQLVDDDAEEARTADKWKKCFICGTQTEYYCPGCRRWLCFAVPKYDEPKKSSKDPKLFALKTPILDRNGKLEMIPEGCSSSRIKSETEFGQWVAVLKN